MPEGKLMPSDIVGEVERVLRGGAAGKGLYPVYLTAYQILEALPQAIRDRLIAERGMPGQGSGSHYGAAGVVGKAAMMLRGIEIAYVQSQSMVFEVDGTIIRPGYHVCGIYRLPPEEFLPLVEEVSAG